MEGYSGKDVREVQRAAEQIRWRKTPGSSNVLAVGWTAPGYGTSMFVKFKGGTMYCYLGVSRQRVVAASRAKSVGKYVHEHIIGQYRAMRVECPVA